MFLPPKTTTQHNLVRELKALGCVFLERRSEECYSLRLAEGRVKHLLGEDNLLLALTLYTHLGDEVQQKVWKGRAQDQLKGLWGRASVRAKWSWKQLLGGKAMFSRPCAGIANGGYVFLGVPGTQLSSPSCPVLTEHLQPHTCL